MSGIPLPVGARLHETTTVASRQHMGSTQKNALAAKLRRRSMAILANKQQRAGEATSSGGGDENTNPQPYATNSQKVSRSGKEFARPAKPLTAHFTRPVPAMKQVLGAPAASVKRFGAPGPTSQSTAFKRPRIPSNPTLNQSVLSQSVLSVATAPAGQAPTRKAKPPAWDLKGQLALLMEQMGDITARLHAVEREKQEKEVEVKTVTVVAAQKGEELETLKMEKRQVSSQLNDCQQMLDQLRSERSRLNNELSNLMMEKSTVDSRLQMLNRDLEEARNEAATLRSDLRRTGAELGAQRDRVGDLERKVQDLTSRLDSSERACSAAKLRIEQLEQQLKDVNRQLDDKSAEVLDLRAKLQAREQAVVELNSRYEASVTNCAQIEGEKNAITRDRDTLRLRVSELIEEVGRLSNEIVKMSEASTEKDERIKGLEADKEEHFRLRKVLHNRVQELKGNIRVFCRSRPLLPAEKTTNAELLKLDMPDIDHKKLMIHTTEQDATGSSRPKIVDFEFDRVFSATDTQAACFEELSQLVQSAMDGYNVAIFAYGQTGSGKTYTMEGLDDWSEHDASFEQRGMIPRAIEQIFTSAAELAVRSWKFDMSVSFIEIYNETLLDLLDDNENQQPHEIQLADKKTSDVIVVGLKAVPIKTKLQFYSLMRQAGRNRHVAETKMNRESSRSHCLCQIRIEGTNEASNETVKSMLSLIDLAGSERLKDSGSTGVRAQEAISINSSLSALSNVIVAIHNRDAHIPYRDSKLTYLLMNSLGGQAKALMFVNFNPCQRFVAETLNSLRFATKVNGCTIGTARRNAGGADSKRK